MIVQIDRKEDNKVFYRVSAAYKEGVPPVPPFIPPGGVFEQNKEFREFLLAKCMALFHLSFLLNHFDIRFLTLFKITVINADRTCLTFTPAFTGPIERTRQGTLENLATEWIPKQKGNISEILKNTKNVFKKDKKKPDPHHITQILFPLWNRLNFLTASQNNWNGLEFTLLLTQSLSYVLSQASLFPEETGRKIQILVHEALSLGCLVVHFLQEG